MGVAFEAVNVEGNPAALQELERRGLRLVPVLTDGTRTFHGWDPERLAEFVGVQKTEGQRLDPAELARRLQRILLASERAILEVPPEGLNVKVPYRERTVRDLVFHLFRLSLAYRDAFEAGYFPESWLLETPPPEIDDSAALARYGAAVRMQLLEWLARVAITDAKVETFYGTQIGPQLLERTVWHAAHHLRQLYALMEGMGIIAKDPLTEAELRGLPLPKSLW